MDSSKQPMFFTGLPANNYLTAAYNIQLSWITAIWLETYLQLFFLTPQLMARSEKTEKFLGNLCRPYY